MIKKLGMVAGALLAQGIGSGTALAVPTDTIAWSSLDQNITVYKDAVDSELYWFVPKLRFQSSNGKTVLRPSTLANGNTQYITRLIPYFTRDLRELVAQNLTNVRQDSQLRPVVAKDIGISLPDFKYSFKSGTVTNYQYLDVPRLVRFELDPDEAALFDELYAEEEGVPVEFTISYDGMMTDKFYNISVSCKQMKRELESGLGKGSGIGVKATKGIYVGADLQAAFISSVQNGNTGITVTSKGELAGMQEMIRRVLNTCFEPVDSDGYPLDRYDPYYDRDDRRDDEDDDSDDRDDHDDEGDTDLLPKATLKLKFKYKSKSSDIDNQTVVKNVSLKDSTSTTVLLGRLAASAKEVDTVKVAPAKEKKLLISSVKNNASAPLASGIRVSDGEQYTINAELIVKVAALGGARTVTWDAAWPKADGDLYYRIGSGNWTPVNRRAIISSDVARGGGELQFYVDRSAIFNKIPENLRKGNIFVPAKFTLNTFAPEFSVQVTGRKIQVK